MPIQSLGDLAQNIMLRRQTAGLKEKLNIHAQEVTTGKAADLAKKVRGDFAPLGALENSLARLGAFKAAITEASMFTEATQAALSVMETTTSELGPRLLQVSSTRDEKNVTIVASDAQTKFKTAVASLNSRVGDRSLFAGKATNGPAVIGAEAMLQIFDGMVAGLTTAVDVHQAIDTWFDDPSGFASVGYLGGTALEPAQIAEGENVTIGVQATDRGIVESLKGLALAAVMDRGALANSAEERLDLANLAGEQLIYAQTARTELQALVGVAENQISTAMTRNAAEESALEIARSQVVSVDPDDAATALQETRNQLETLYAVSARLSGLKLTDFLR